ncbi:MAG: hypothetical protein MUC49_00425 [Raineya sp.]|jgi:hypothetical protein|nr:hypothetical protein [Raineya sp.]
MKNYISRHTNKIDIKIHQDIYIWIDCEDMYIYEADGNMTDSFLRYMLCIIPQLEPTLNEDSSWYWHFLYGVDYCNFEIEQLSWNTIRVKTAFTDDSDKLERLCDAQIFWKKILEEVDFLLDKVANHDTIYTFPSPFQQKIYLKNWQEASSLLQEFYRKHYEVS